MAAERMRWRVAAASRRLIGLGRAFERAARAFGLMVATGLRDLTLTDAVRSDIHPFPMPLSIAARP